MRSISLVDARRFAISSQHLAGPRVAANKEGILQIIRDLGCIQIDPINIVAPSHQIVLWSRLGQYDLANFKQLMWEEHQLLEDWGHCTSIVPTTDYPIFKTLKREWKPPQKFQQWLTNNQKLRRYILSEIRQHGPLPTAYFKDKADVDWTSTGWTAGRNITQMLTYLWITGKIMVAHREGNTKYWDLAQRVLPKWTPTEGLTSQEVRLRIAERALQALGLAQPNHIRYYYIRGIPENIAPVLSKLASQGQIEQIQIIDSNTQQPLRGTWYIHKTNHPLLERIETKDWTGRTTLLSPFDNLIYERTRIEQLFNFKYRLEIYVPKKDRQFGPYALPILFDDQFIGRIDAKLNRETNQLEIRAIHSESNAPLTKEVGEEIQSVLNQFVTFLKAETIQYSKNIPKEWK
ncbi:MAG: winged helix-turn-helix domain-containing protein [Candidatus Hermodarchaeia archaeon]|jgi:uncharacterized protein YcaQ